MLKTTFHAPANIPRAPSTSPHFLHSQSILADGLLARCVRTESTTQPTQPLPKVQCPPIPILCSYTSKAPSTPPSIKPNYNTLPTSYNPTRPNPSARSCSLTLVGNHSPAPEFKSCHYDTSGIYMKKPCSPTPSPTFPNSTAYPIPHSAALR